MATALNANISGTPITQVRDDIYLINVVARELGGVIQSDAGPIISHYLLLPSKETPYARY